MPDPSLLTKPGATYKFVVRTPEEAVQTIRDRLGENAKVLSVRQVPNQGLGGLFSKPKLEVVVQVAEQDPGSASAEYHPDLPQPANFAGSLISSTANLGSSLPETASMTRVTGSIRDKLPPLPDLLRRAGFSETLLGRLQGTRAFPANDTRPLHHALVEVGQQLRQQASNRRLRPLPSRTAFLGTAGVGRTTALCKWLALEVFKHQRSGRVLKAEFDLPNPAEGLAVFCEALGLGLEYYAPESPDLPSTVGGPAGEFLYADLPGISLRSPAENKTLAHFLERENFAGRVLVLNAAYDSSMLRRAYAAGCDLGATHVVFTHLDEVDHWGRLWDFLLDGELTPLFLATGPSLTGDCDEDPIGAVIRKTLPGA